MKRQLISSFIGRLVLLTVFLTCALITPAQSFKPELMNGRWNLVVENDLWRSEMAADLRVESDGAAKLVILAPADGEDGLFNGAVTGDRLWLKGRYERSNAEFDLKLTGNGVSGKMAGDNWSVEVQGHRAQIGGSEVSVKRYGMLFEAVWNGVSKYFYDPKLNGVDPATVRQRYLPQVKAARNDGELTVAIRQSLRELRTSHTEFFLSTGTPPTKLKNDRVAWKQLAPDVSYLALLSFTAEDLQQFDKMIDRAMDEVVKRPALVLDLRGNRGENLEAALAALNFLLPEGRSVAYFATRDGLTRLGVSSIDQIDPSSLPAAFVDNQIGVSKFQGAGMYLAGGKYKRPFRGRIVLLIDETCAGSCELFAAAMKEAGAATLIGRQTKGALLFSTPVTFTFAKMMSVFKSDVKGWRMDLPTMDIRTAGRKKIEGNGVEPDVTADRSTSSDAELARALQWLEEKKRR
jgi:C-terminal processing protease CtpA/Prc